MKKKIFFLLSSMNVGGVEKAFLNMLPYIPEETYEIHLGLLSYKGGFLKDIPEYVHVHEIACYDLFKHVINDPPRSVIKEMIREGRYLEAVIQTFLYLHFKLTNNRYWFYKYILRNIPEFPIHFDLAVAYAGPSQAVDYFISKKIDATKKCGWVHFDVTKFGIDAGMTRKLYPKYNKIFLVSQTAKQNFDNLFPMLKHKTDVFYNIVSPQLISQMSGFAPTFTDEYQGKRILTVGRISEEKGQNFAIQALKRLRDKGYEVRWYFVGDGVFRKHCEELAVQLGVEENIIFLGVEKNPYGYMKDCDVYVQPSRHEGYCITLAEARVFTHPIVSTDFVGAREQLSTRSNGIVTGFGEEEIAAGIVQSLHMNDCDPGNRPVFHTDMHKFLDLLN